MGYPKEIYDQAHKILTDRRRAARAEGERRTEEIYRRIPRLKEIDRALSQTGLSVAKSVLAGGDITGQIKKLKEENLSLQKEKTQLLQQVNLSADYLDTPFTCKKCGDTGYAAGRMCDCLQELLKQQAFSSLIGAAASKSANFDSFRLDYYPEKANDPSQPSPRKIMTEIFHICRDYADHFSPQSSSLFLIGGTGLGKTHLSLSIASKVIQHGFGAIYLPAQRLFDRLEKERFGRDSAGEEKGDFLDLILSCDLLIIDDLGSEFSTNFTAAALYNIINTRLAEGRPTIVNSNLDVNKIEPRYGERLVSRLLCGYQVLKFQGRDIRMIQKYYQK